MCFTTVYSIVVSAAFKRLVVRCVDGLVRSGITRATLAFSSVVHRQGRICKAEANHHANVQNVVDQSTPSNT